MRLLRTLIFLFAFAFSFFFFSFFFFLSFLPLFFLAPFLAPFLALVFPPFLSAWPPFRVVDLDFFLPVLPPLDFFPRFPRRDDEEEVAEVETDVDADDRARLAVEDDDEDDVDVDEPRDPRRVTNVSSSEYECCQRKRGDRDTGQYVTIVRARSPLLHPSIGPTLATSAFQ